MCTVEPCTEGPSRTRIRAPLPQPSAPVQVDESYCCCATRYLGQRTASSEGGPKEVLLWDISSSDGHHLPASLRGALGCTSLERHPSFGCPRDLCLAGAVCLSLLGMEYPKECMNPSHHIPRNVLLPEPEGVGGADGYDDSG